MSEKPQPFSEKPLVRGDPVFSAEATRDEMRGHIRSIVELSTDSRKVALDFAARLLRLPLARVKSLYYGEARRVDAHEADQIRAYVEAATRLIQARADYEKQRREFLATAHPALVRMAPPPLDGPGDAEGDAQETATPAAKRGRAP